MILIQYMYLTLYIFHWLIFHMFFTGMVHFQYESTVWLDVRSDGTTASHISTQYTAQNYWGKYNSFSETCEVMGEEMQGLQSDQGQD